MYIVTALKQSAVTRTVVRGMYVTKHFKSFKLMLLSFTNMYWLQEPQDTITNIR